MPKFLYKISKNVFLTDLEFWIRVVSRTGSESAESVAALNYSHAVYKQATSLWSNVYSNDGHTVVQMSCHIYKNKRAVSLHVVQVFVFTIRYHSPLSVRVG